MTTHLVNDIADIIREVDGGGEMGPRTLGREIAWHAKAPKSLARVPAADVAAFIERTNPDKQLGADALAELIVAEFDLDKES